MIRTLVVADCGAAMASITATLAHVADVDIVAYASGARPIAAVLRSTTPDVVLVDEMRRPGLGVRRIAEARATDPSVAVIGLADRVSGGWAPGALRAGAAAVVPADLEPATLARVLHEVVGMAAARTSPVRRAA